MSTPSPALRSRTGLPVAALAVLLAGCATAPAPLQGQFSALSPLQSSESAASGERVRWGGEIVSVDTRPDRTCFELLGKPLLDTARPRRSDDSAGRFYACRSGFYDPALFAPGRELTVTGVVEGFDERPIGEYRYRYPRVAVDVLYLWPERLPEYRYHDFGPAWPHYRSSLWGGYWYPRRVIVVRPPPPPPGT
jgi:outer membrane lipoprotein